MALMSLGLGWAVLAGPPAALPLTARVEMLSRGLASDLVRRLVRGRGDKSRTSVATRILEPVYRYAEFTCPSLLRWAMWH